MNLRKEKQRTAHSSYREKLNDPRWKKRRLEILKRDNDTCQKCDHISKSNHVHHVVYFFGFEPWEYEDEFLITLCDDCHESEHKDEKQIKDIINNMKIAGFFCYEIKAKMNLNFDL